MKTGWYREITENIDMDYAPYIFGRIVCLTIDNTSIH